MVKRALISVLPAFLLALMCALPRPLIAQRGASASNANGVSGTYNFLREGEFVQLTVEDGRLSGYISRFGDSESDKDQFIDQFFDKASLEGDRLNFNTKTVHGVSYDFSGVIATVAGKKSSDEGYRVIRGKLIQHSVNAGGAAKTQQRQVEFKSFPDTVNR